MCRDIEHVAEVLGMQLVRTHDDALSKMCQALVVVGRAHRCCVLSPDLDGQRSVDLLLGLLECTKNDTVRKHACMAL